MGDYEQAEAAIAQSIELLQVDGRNAAQLTQVLDTRAHLYQLRGQSQAAIATWEQAANLYRHLGNAEGLLGSQLNQVDSLLRERGAYNDACERVMQALGWSQYSCADLADEAVVNPETWKRELTALEQRLPVSLRAASFYYLGVALLARDALPRSQALLERRLAIAAQQRAIASQMETRLQLGNIARTLGEGKMAREHYQAASALGASRLGSALVKAYLNQLDLLRQLDEVDAAAALLEPIDEQLPQLPAGRDRLLGRLSFARQLADWPDLTQADRAQQHL